MCFEELIYDDLRRRCSLDGEDTQPDGFKDGFSAYVLCKDTSNDVSI